MPIYIYRCPKCDAEVEEIRSFSEFDAPGPTCKGGAFSDPAAHAPVTMTRAPTTASIAFATPGGNVASFSSSRGPIARGNRRPKTISTGHGLGGHRPHASPRTDPKFRETIVGMVKKGSA